MKTIIPCIFHRCKFFRSLRYQPGVQDKKKYERQLKMVKRDLYPVFRKYSSIPGNCSLKFAFFITTVHLFDNSPILLTVNLCFAVIVSKSLPVISVFKEVGTRDILENLGNRDKYVYSVFFRLNISRSYILVV